MLSLCMGSECMHRVETKLGLGAWGLELVVLVLISISESNLRRKGQEEGLMAPKGRGWPCLAIAALSFSSVSGTVLLHVAPRCGQKSLFGMDCCHSLVAQQQSEQKHSTGLSSQWKSSRKGLEPVRTHLALTELLLGLASRSIQLIGLAWEYSWGQRKALPFTIKSAAEGKQSLPTSSWNTVSYSIFDFMFSFILYYNTPAIPRLKEANGP